MNVFFAILCFAGEFFLRTLISVLFLTIAGSLLLITLIPFLFLALIPAVFKRIFFKVPFCV